MNQLLIDTLQFGDEVNLAELLEHFKNHSATEARLGYKVIDAKRVLRKMELVFHQWKSQYSFKARASENELLFQAREFSPLIYETYVLYLKKIAELTLKTEEAEISYKAQVNHLRVLQSMRVITQGNSPTGILSPDIELNKEQ